MWSHPPESLPLQKGEAHVWRIRLEYPPELLEPLLRTLTEDERARADRFYFERHRRRFIVARGTLRALIGRYLGARPQDLRFRYGAYGKPALDGEYRDVTLRFNASHSHEMAMFAFVAEYEIGVDVERINKSFATHEIANRFFSPREIETLAGLSAADHVLEFFRIWTRKEAYLKATGWGLSQPIEQIDVPLGPPWSVFDLDTGEEFAAALAVEGPVHSLLRFES